MNQKLDAYHLKWIALITMFIDHTGVIILLPLLGSNSIVYVISRLIGRLAFPLFAFMLVEAMTYSRNKEKYVLRLAFMALLIGIGMTGLLWVNVNVFAGNIFVDLTLAAVTIYMLNHRKIWVRLFAFIPLVYIAVLQQNNLALSQQLFFFNAIRADYGIYGYTLILSLYLAKKINLHYERKRLLVEASSGYETMVIQQQSNLYSGLALIAINTFWYVLFLLQPTQPQLQFMGAQSYAILTMFFLFSYTGKKGKSPRYFQLFTYLYYPLHFVVIYLIYEIIIVIL